MEAPLYNTIDLTFMMWFLHTANLCLRYVHTDCVEHSLNAWGKPLREHGAPSRKGRLGSPQRWATYAAAMSCQSLTGGDGRRLGRA